MKERYRKPLLFLVIVVVGTLLVMTDIPLLLLLPLVIVVGFVTLLALGSITIAEIRAGISSMGKSGILKRLNDIKFMEKKPAGAAPAAAPQPAPAKPAQAKEQKKETKKETGSRPGIRGHLTAFTSSIRSFGSVLRARNRQGKKVEDINKLLDKTVKGEIPAPVTAQPPAKASSPRAPAGGGMAAKDAGSDPFVSLSGDEFDEELLKGLGDDLEPGMPADLTAPGPGTGGPASVDSPALSMPDLTAESEGDLPAPDEDLDAAANDILRQAGETVETGPDEFKGPGGTGDDLSGEDLGDLDGLSLDDVDLDGETDAPPVAAPVPDAPPEPAAAASGAPKAGAGAVKTAWIPSDAPKDAGEAPDEISTQSDMAAFASGPGGDEDLLSSIASDVKHTKKDIDLSLVRELRDFRAPASEIEKELDGMYERMNLAHDAQKKKPSPAPVKGKK